MNASDEPYREYPARSSGARVALIFAIVVILAIIAAFAFGLIDINQTKSGSLPQVSVQGGSAPSFDVSTAKVEVGTKTSDVTVPTVDVGSKTKEVQVPTVDIKKAN